VSKYCVVISGRLPGDKEDNLVWRPIADAFKLDAATFTARVLLRMPMIVRQNLDQEAADTMAEQLRAVSVDAKAVPQDDRLALIERNGQTKGPLPFSNLGDFIRDGERYRFRESNEWITWGQQALTLELPLIDFPEIPSLAPAAQNVVDTQATHPAGSNAGDNMPPELPAQHAAASSIEDASSPVGAADNQANPPPLPPVAFRTRPSARSAKKANPYAKVIGVVACLLLAWLVLKGLGSNFDSDASSFGGSSSGPGSHMDSSDLQKIASGHYYLVEFKPNGESNSWIGKDDGKLTNVVYQVGNGFIQECFMEQGEKSPSNCAPPMIEISNGGSVHSKCVGGEGKMSGNSQSIWVCVSDIPVQGEAYDSGSGFNQMTISPGVPYIEKSSFTSFGGGSVRHMRFKVVDSDDAVQLPAATGQGGK
jgi:hypothetical protein